MRPIQNVQVLRALAALIVVVFHIQGELRHRGFDDPFPNLTIGAFGVDLFFVISGFIMVYASVPLFGRARAGARFLVRRVVRIAPLYWVFTTLFALIAVVLARDPDHPGYSAAHILASYLFVPWARPEDGSMFPTYSLGWTLNYEMFFYVCFSLALAWRRSVAVAAAATGLAVLVGVGALADLPWPLDYWAKSLTLEFVFGMLIAQAYLRGYRLPRLASAALTVGALTAIWTYVPYIDSHSAWRGIAWGLPAALILSAALSLESARSGPMRRAFASLGDASYSLYLVHSTLFIAVAFGFSRVVDPHLIPSPLYAGLLLAGSILAACLLFGGFERPVTRSLQRMLVRRSGPASRERDAGPDIPDPAPIRA